VNSSVTIPAGLEPGWHTLTFTSTAADGSSVVSKVYFEISATGTLLSNTTTIPAALANTGFDSQKGVYVALGLLIAGLLALAGMQVARRRNS
jgi:LPXTG-motif cell wall-anchored protein